MVGIVFSQITMEAMLTPFPPCSWRGNPSLSLGAFLDYSRRNSSTA
uniref:Uncharacterized protein n=1 Tax=Arundo donax TaxID=35708 RepID=A0A0A9BGN5_ARUDO